MPYIYGASDSVTDSSVSITIIHIYVCSIYYGVCQDDFEDYVDWVALNNEDLIDISNAAFNIQGNFYDRD